MPHSSPDSFPLGQLCLKYEGNPQRTPRRIFDDNVLSFAAGMQSSYILFENGSIRSCGLNSDGQLGDGSFNDNFDTSVKLDGISSAIINVYAGPSSKSAFFEAEDGKVYGTGLNDRGQLGVENTDSSNIPVEVEFSASSETGWDISASNTHTFA